MSFFGDYLGAPEDEEPEDEDELVPVAAPIVSTSPAYVDHVELALARLLEQFKSRGT